MAMRDALFPGDSELAALMRRTDWASTLLGPVESWSHKLRAAVGIVLTSRFPMWMGWGDDLAFLYNDAYRTDTLGPKHPAALGMAAREVWREIWPEIGPRITQVMVEGQATWDEGLLLMLERYGYPEETYHTFSYSPLHDDDGVVRGMLCVVVEETARLISERRVALLGRLAAEIAGSSTEAAVLDGLARCLGSDARDLPFTLTYALDDGGGTARLVAQTGFADGSPRAPAVIRIDDQAPWSLATAIEAGRGCEVALDGEWPAGPWPTPPRSAFVVPLAQQGQTRPAGVWIAGINPHRRFDTAYLEFLQLFAGQLAAGLANARAYALERHRAEMLAELDRAKTTFFSNVSHEFRTPLTLMLGPLDGLLADAALPSPINAELATIQRNALRLLKLVNTMLDFSRIEAGRAVAQFHPVDLAELTIDLASSFRAAAERAGLQLVVDCPPLDAVVRVDRDMWEKIVLNLVSNAFKFTLAGEIRVALTRRGDQARLEVADTGGGIPADELPRIFERFHRVVGTKGRTHEGTGIGLALVQELVRLHGGTVEVASELGRGTHFTVSIPIGERAPAAASAPDREPPRRRSADAFVSEAMRWLPDAPAAPGARAAARERLLIADDNADMRDYLRRLLGARWEIETVANGRQALAAIRTRRPDLVITDIMMPELDGFGLVAALRGDPGLRDVPVIMLSARAGEEARIEGLQAGASDYLVKPFGSRDLVAHVETHLLRAAVRAVEQANARRLATIFEQAPIAIAILRGPDHVFEIANAMYQRLTGDRAVLGLPLATALPEIGAQGFIEILDRVRKDGEPYVGRSEPVVLARGEGGETETVYVDFIYQPLFESDRTVGSIAVIAHDVTALATANRAAESANQAKDEFLAMLGHELRNPLAPIITALDLMRMQRDLGAERERAVIERQVAHMVGLVDDLLDVSRITRGKVELRTGVVDVADVVARAVEVASPLLEESRHELAIDVARGLFVHGDGARLAQVASNLLTNAAKYTPKGGRISVRARRDGAQVVLTVADDGIGIEAAMLARVFEPFAQARQSLARSQGGLGLGLAIVANLVALHGGTVRAHSAGPGAGSEFTVSLPALEPPEVLPVASAPAAVNPAQAGRVLLVDDNADAVDMLKELLTRDGHHIEVAYDAPSALEIAASFRPHIAVLDLGLPVVDGFELARLLRQQPASAATRVVALTGYGQAGDRRKTAEAGFVAHLVKPINLEKLRSLIDSLLPAPAAR
jgi:signal transduction histidine kinase